MDNVDIKIRDIIFSLTCAQDNSLVNIIKDKLNNCGVLDVDEQVALDNFNNLCSELNSIPTSGTLVSSDNLYQTANTIRPESLEDMTKLFINKKMKIKLGTVLTNSTMELGKPGANIEAIIEKVSNALVVYNPKDVEEDKINTTDLESMKSKLHEVKEEIKGIKFGIDVVDQIYPGVTPGSYNIIAGYTGSFKTTIALNMCYIGMQTGYNSLYISLEINKEDVMLNLLSLHSYNMGEPVKRSDMTKLRYTDPDKFDRILESLYALPGKIEIYDESDIERYSTTVFGDIIRKTDKMFHDKHNSKLDHVVLDHAQLLKFDTQVKTNDAYMVLNVYASYFRQQAAKNGYAVTLVSQTSRNGYEYACKHGGQYLLTGLAEGNELERGATFVLAAFINDGLKASGQLQVQILKNRYGETMLEPQLTNIKPEYYVVGNGYNKTPQQVESVFDTNGNFTNPFEVTEEINLDSLLGGM